MAKSKGKAKEKEKEKEKPREKERPVAPRPRLDAYVMMLFISLVAMAGGATMMYLDFDEYGQKAPPKEPVPAPAKLGEGTKSSDTAPAGGGGAMPPGM